MDTTVGPHSSDETLGSDLLPIGLANHPDYEIVRELGRGGMGVVYLAHNRLMGRDEVLKVIGRDAIYRPGAMDRFLREIRAVARLRHPNIVTAYTAFRNGESLVFAMEYVEGLDLARMVEARGPMPVAHACHFIQQAALGLDHAHEHAMVHRDIKPSNLMLSRNRDKALVKILDFGLARAARENTAAEREMDGGDDTLRSGFDLTGAGQVLGTPAFIAPEQIAASREADIRADIYSLGCTLYYLLSGGPPFPAETVLEILRAQSVKDARRLNLVRPDVPPDLAALVARMMAKEPDQRFQTPDEVTRAVAPFSRNTSRKAELPGSKDSRKFAPAAGLVTTVSDQAATAPAPTPDTTALSVADNAVKRPEEIWQSLINFDDPDDIPQAPAAESRPVPSRPRWFAPVAGLAGCAAALLCVGVTYRSVTKSVTEKRGEKTVASVRQIPPSPVARTPAETDPDDRREDRSETAG